MKEETDSKGTNGASILAASVFSGAGIGIMVGVLLGLAMSPTVAGFVAAIGAALAALLGLNDRHFSLAKGVRIGVFGIFAVLGAPAGLYLKNHSVFAPSLEERKANFVALGYSECQALDLLAGKSLQTYPPKDNANLNSRKQSYLELGFSECEALGLLVSGPEAGQSTTTARANETASGKTPIQQYVDGAGLMASAFETTSCELLVFPEPDQLDFGDIRTAFEDAGDAWKKWTIDVSKTNLSADEKKALLLIGRDAVCADNHSEDDCRRLQASALTGKDLGEAFSEMEAFNKWHARLLGDIDSGTSQPQAFKLLNQAMCNVSN